MEQYFISGFIKAAEAHGFTVDEAIELYKQADHPFRREQAAMLKSMDEQIAASVYNRHHHPGHYWLNPFVGGPLTELGRRGQRRIHATMQNDPVGSIVRPIAYDVAGGVIGGVAGGTIGANIGSGIGYMAGQFGNMIKGDKEKRMEARDLKFQGHKEELHKQQNT